MILIPMVRNYKKMKQECKKFNNLNIKGHWDVIRNKKINPSKSSIAYVLESESFNAFWVFEENFFVVCSPVS